MNEKDLKKEIVKNMDELFCENIETLIKRVFEYVNKENIGNVKDLIIKAYSKGQKDGQIATSKAIASLLEKDDSHDKEIRKEK